MLAPTAEAEAPSRKVVYLPLLDRYPGLGLLYCIWLLECSLPTAFLRVSQKKKKIVFRGRLITFFIPPSSSRLGKEMVH